MMIFEANHVVRTHTIQLAARPEKVFPLFEPIGETQWATGFKPEMRYPASGNAEEGAVFTTKHHGESNKIWIIAAYDPKDYCIKYINVTPDSHVTVLEIHCDANTDGTTQAHVTCAFTALTERGNEYVARHTDEYYREFISLWETGINHFLRHGRPMQHHH